MFGRLELPIREVGSCVILVRVGAASVGWTEDGVAVYGIVISCFSELA